MNYRIYSSLVDEARNIREEVFIKEQKFSYDVDEIDKIASHLVLYLNNIPVGTCRFFKEDDETLILGRFAVLKEYRNQGLGKEIIKIVENEAKIMNINKLKIHSQLQVLDFYLNQGFSIISDIDIEDGCPHKWVIKEI